jgi:probable O-glycosylation ligase (exosortase A-associated)
MRDYVYAATVIMLVPVILWRPWIGILAWTLFGLLNPQQLTWGLQQFPFAAIIGGATLIGLLFTKGRRPVPITSQTLLLATLAAWCTITTIGAWAGDIAWDQWSKVMKIYLMIFVTVMLIYGTDRTKALLLTIAGGIALYGAKGAIFTMLTGGVYRVEGPGGYLAGNTNFGCSLVMVLPLIDAVARDRKKRWERMGLWMTFWLVVVSVVFTYSRGALLGLGVVFVLMFFQIRHKLLVLLMLIPVFIVSVGALPEQLVDRAETIRAYDADTSAMGRVQAWGVAWNIAVTHPLGAGFEVDKIDNPTWLSYAFFHDSYIFNHAIAAHSIFFQILGEHGFVGLFIYLALMATTLVALRRCKRQAASAEQTRWMVPYARALQVSIAGYAVAGAFLSLAYFDLYYAFVAMAVIFQKELAAAVPLVVQRKQSGDGVMRRNDVPKPASV